jgi:hypothetical protein
MKELVAGTGVLRELLDCLLGDIIGVCRLLLDGCLGSYKFLVMWVGCIYSFLEFNLTGIDAMVALVLVKIAVIWFLMVISSTKMIEPEIGWRLVLSYVPLSNVAVSVSVSVEQFAKRSVLSREV